MFSLFCSVLLGVAAVRAFPTLFLRDDITSLSTSQVDSYDAYTYFAKAVYCNPSTTRTWSCGPCTRGNPGFQVEATGGDGDAIQYWFVGYSPHHGVVVAHQGTNTSHIKAITTDVKIVREPLDQSLFPGVPSDIGVHSGFQEEHAKTASDVLAAVQSVMLKHHGTTSVTMVGHSLGAALALLDSVYLPFHLPQTTTFKTVVYGLPRVGNQEFADYVDAHVHLTHINNLEDPIPITPGMSLGYRHPSGEVHITTGGWKNCTGQDNPSPECIVGTVSSIFTGHEADHDGPYNGIEMHCKH